MYWSTDKLNESNDGEKELNDEKDESIHIRLNDEVTIKVNLCLKLASQIKRINGTN